MALPQQFTSMNKPIKTKVAETLNSPLSFFIAKTDAMGARMKES
jgi:hypothetical protein